MQVIYGIDRIKKFKRPVVALGVFDGVHRGHARILETAVSLARRIKGTAIAFTFNPHPQKEGSLSSLAHRLKLIKALGIDVCVVVNFNRAFARIEARPFVERILVKKMQPAYVCVGSDFRFGQKARGGIHLLEKLSHRYNFKLRVIRIIRQSGRRISSSRIRRLIFKGSLGPAEKLLGRRVSLLGEVEKGSSLGKKLGFPTANINPHHEIYPASGVYAVKVLLGARYFNGICSIGTRPTFTDSTKKKIEVLIFNFNRNIYGKYLEVLFIKRIREQKKFNSAQTLIEQINKDISKVRKIFASCP